LPGRRHRPQRRQEEGDVAQRVHHQEQQDGSGCDRHFFSFAAGDAALCLPSFNYQ
jgi:hypothetical protein